MLRAPRLPWTVRAMNALGRPLAARLAALSLREEDLLAEARRRTGLDDFGDDGFRPGLRVLCRALEAEARLTPLGRVIARRDVLTGLENRLRLRDWRRRHPEIADQRVERPLVVIGMARTGTTLLHELLAQDPANRVPLTWEVERPCPPPERASYDRDPRIAESDLQLAQTDRLLPEFRHMHPMGARLPQECVRILHVEMASIAFPLCYRAPSYAAWLLGEADLAGAYAGHRRVLQLLQWRCPGRWVLKSPCHLWHLRALLTTYPDALLVQTHRDPLRVLSSLTSLATTLRAMASDRVDSRELAREWAGYNARAFEAAVDARERGLVRLERVVDVQFAEVLRDPIGVVRRIYARDGRALAPEAESRMRAFLAAQPRDAHGRHRHRFADTGLDARAERERVRRYQEFFGVASEEVG